MRKLDLHVLFVLLEFALVAVRRLSFIIKIVLNLQCRDDCVVGLAGASHYCEKVNFLPFCLFIYLRSRVSQFG